MFVADAALDPDDSTSTTTAVGGCRKAKVRTLGGVSSREAGLPVTVAEFEDDTAFERYVLGRIASLLPDSDATKVVELGSVDANGVPAQGSSVRLTATDGTGGTKGALTAEDVRPLLFGAAWKILDLLVELVLESSRPVHKQREWMSITSKVNQAKNGGVKDLEIHLRDGRVLAGPLEDAPQGAADLSINTPPAWLTWQ